MPDNQPAFKVKANEFVFSFSQSATAAANFIKTSSTAFNLVHRCRSVNGRLLQEDATGKKLTLEVDGEIFVIEIKDELDQVLEQMGFGTASGKQVKEIKAPMPGMVLEVNVVDGQEVKEGDKLLILGAMKMENSIMIHSAATIKHVAVIAGQAVDKGQMLVELE